MMLSQRLDELLHNTDALRAKVCGSHNGNGNTEAKAVAHSRAMVDLLKQLDLIYGMVMQIDDGLSLLGSTGKLEKLSVAEPDGAKSPGTVYDWMVAISDRLALVDNYLMSGDKESLPKPGDSASVVDLIYYHLESSEKCLGRIADAVAGVLGQ